MNFEQEKKCRIFAEQLNQLKIIAEVGCPDIHIRSITSSLRDIKENYSKYWRDAGFDDAPLINGFMWIDSMLTTNDRAVYWGGAYEIPTPASVIKANMLAHGMSIPDGYEIMDGECGDDYYLSTNNSSFDCTIGVMPCDEKEMSIGKYFEVSIIFWDGKSLNRSDVIEYASYELGHIHTDAKKYQKNKPEKCAILNQINDSPVAFKRNNILYILLSIARAVSKAECTTRYLLKFGF